MRWNKFTLKTRSEVEVIVISTLAEAGVEGVEIEDKVPLTEQDKQQMFVDILPDGPADDGIAYLNFYLDEKEDKEKLLANVKDALEELRMFVDIGEGTITESQTEDKDWINNWKQYFHQFYVDDILIIPSWEEVKPEDKDKMIIHIDPGTAFGTGMHETTQLCMRQLKKYVKDGMEILDVGTGTGYFAILLSQSGHQVTGIDLTDAMLKEARDNAALYQVHPTFQQMDAQKLAFLDQSFDVVISRNLTWTLPDPESAYREWMRVLKKGGILLNFDADYASNVRNQNTSASHISDTEVYGHCGVTPELEQENASITLSMPMSRKQRPYWDQEFLENIGFSRSGYDLSVGQNILKEHDLKDAPMFLVWGVR